MRGTDDTGDDHTWATKDGETSGEDPTRTNDDRLILKHQSLPTQPGGWQDDRMGIMEFLEQRISEDEDRARIAAEHFPTTSEWWDFTGKLHLAGGRDLPTRQGLRHADKHSPEFVLAECAAKRAIIAHLSSIDRTVDPAGHHDYVQKVLFAMALPYGYEVGE